MIVNSVQSLFHRESADANFTVASQALHAVFADGTTADPTVTVDSGTGAKIHDLTSDVLTLAVPGKLRATWSVGIGSQIFKRVELYFVSVFDIAEQVRDVLRVSSTALPDEDIDGLLIEIVDDLEESYPTCFPYRSLTGQDQYWCDRGLAYTVAAYLLAQNPGRFLGGPVKAVRDAQIRYEFAINPNTKARTRAEELLGFGWTEIQRIGCIVKLNSASPSLLYATSGSRRGTYDFVPDMTGNEHIPLITGLLRSRVLI